MINLCKPFFLNRHLAFYQFLRPKLWMKTHIAIFPNIYKLYSFPALILSWNIFRKDCTNWIMLRLSKNRMNTLEIIMKARQWWGSDVPTPDSSVLPHGWPLSWFLVLHTSVIYHFSPSSVLSVLSPLIFHQMRINGVPWRGFPVATLPHMFHTCWHLRLGAWSRTMGFKPLTKAKCPDEWGWGTEGRASPRWKWSTIKMEPESSLHMDRSLIRVWVCKERSQFHE